MKTQTRAAFSRRQLCEGCVGGKNRKRAIAGLCGLASGEGHVIREAFWLSNWNIRIYSRRSVDVTRIVGVIFNHLKCTGISFVYGGDYSVTEGLNIMIRCTSCEVCLPLMDERQQERAIPTRESAKVSAAWPVWSGAERKRVSRPVSRVLSPPLRTMDGHSSGTPVTGRL